MNRYLSRRSCSLVRRYVIVISIGLISVGWIMTGCSSAGNEVLPTPLVSKVSTNGTADDHMAAALLYQQEAERLRAKADRYEREAKAIDPLADTKGFRRQALVRAAHENQVKARNMERLYAEHRSKAETMTGQKQRQ